MDNAPRTWTDREARDRGFAVDTTCYPWVAYKGARFNPTEWHSIQTPPANTGLDNLAELELSCGFLLGAKLRGGATAVLDVIDVLYPDNQISPTLKEAVRAQVSQKAVAASVPPWEDNPGYSPRAG